MHSRHVVKSCLVLLSLVWGGVRTAGAQVATAQITGTVHDPSGAVVPGAQITSIQPATGLKTTTTTSIDGFFVLRTLPVGAYTLTVTAPGFSTYKQTQLTLTVGQQLNLDVPLTIGNANQSVTVTAASVAVDTTGPTQQNTIEQKTVQNLPLNGRNPATLTFTVAGVNDSALNVTSSNFSSTVKEADAANPQESAPSVHGARPGGTYFSLDGANNTDPFTVIGGPFPNPDATGEFSVVTGTYGSRYVSAPGGAVNIVTRSGTNNIHGTVFEFIRNGYFNSRNALSTVPDVLKRNQFGFAAGGPIKHDRLFLFGSYQGTIIRNNLTSVAYVPTTPERSGNFGTFQIPTTFMSPAIQKYLSYIPLGDSITGRLSFQTPNNSTEQQGVAKLDYVLGGHRLFARAFYDRYVLAVADATQSAGVLSQAPGFIQPWTSFAVGDTWSHGKWIFDSRASFDQALATQTVGTNFASYSNLGITGMSGMVPQPGFALTYVLNGFQANNGSPSRFPRRELEFSEDVFATLGRHQLSVGASYQRIRLSESNLSQQNPVAVYVGVNSLVYGMYGIIPGATYNAMADFIMGEPYQFLQGDGIFANVSGNLVGAYGEDNYRITDKLTATFGLRWDPFLSYNVDGQRVTCFIPNEQSKVFLNAPAGEVFPGDSGCPHNGLQSSFAQFQPRVGLAYQLDQGKTSVRAGYGRYDLQAPLQSYVKFSNQPWERSYTLSQPFISIDNLWAGIGQTDPFAAGFFGPKYIPAPNVAFATGLGTASFDLHSYPGYIQQWSLSLQHMFTNTDSLELAYNGTAGVHLPLSESLNTPAYGPGASTTNENARRPYPQFGIVSNLASTATSSYQGLDVTYKHQGKSVTINSVFTWSKALDDASTPGFGTSVSIPNTDHSFRRGRSDFDQNLVSRTTGTWVLPAMEKYNPFARAVLGSWTLSGLVILDAGQPFSVTDSGDFSYTGLGIDYADRVPGVSVWNNQRLNIAAFTDNAPGTFGNSGRNAYRGPANLDVDTALMKNFPIFERVTGLFRAEAFNLFNHPNFFFPTAPVYSPTAQSTFGVYTNARDPRILQFSIKLMF